MCEICEKRKTLALKLEEAKKLGRRIEAVQSAFVVAAGDRDEAGMASARADYHRHLDSLMDIHAEVTVLGSEINTATILAIFGDEDVEEHLSRGSVLN